MVAERWDNPVDAVAALVEFSRPLTAQAKTSFIQYLETSWLSSKSPSPPELARYRGYIAQIKGVFAKDSAAACKHAEHCKNPPGWPQALPKAGA